MELWLLGAGAIVLVAITLWIVWPARTSDVVGTTVQDEEVSRTMTENVGPVQGPLGNQYTSATADLSTGSVATTVDRLPNENTPADASSHRWSPPSAGEDYSSPLSTSTGTRSLAQPRKIGLGAGALLSIGGAVGGAWLYARWQRERSKPISRLRRGARDVASRLGERMPDVEDLPHGAAPVSGAATVALLVTGLLASRAMRREAPNRIEEVQEAAAHIEPRKRGILGIGFGGLAILAGGTYMVWRFLRGGSPAD